MMSPEAKQARYEYDKKRKAKDPEKIREQQRAWRERNREKYNAYMRNYYHSNKERHNQRQAEYWERVANEKRQSEA